MTETESMVERVAKAIFDIRPWGDEDSEAGVSWEAIDSAWQDAYRLMARAAIEAMRDCDNDMLEAMHSAMFEDNFTGGELPMLNAGWVAALDKALEE